MNTYLSLHFKFLIITDAMNGVVNIYFLHCVFKKLFPNNSSIIQSSIPVRHTKLL